MHASVQGHSCDRALIDLLRNENKLKRHLSYFIWCTKINLYGPKTHTCNLQPNRAGLYSATGLPTIPPSLKIGLAAGFAAPPVSNHSSLQGRNNDPPVRSQQFAGTYLRSTCQITADCRDIIPCWFICKKDTIHRAYGRDKAMIRVGQNHTYMVYTRYFLQGFHQIYTVIYGV